MYYTINDLFFSFKSQPWWLNNKRQNLFPVSGSLDPYWDEHLSSSMLWKGLLTKLLILSIIGKMYGGSSDLTTQAWACRTAPIKNTESKNEKPPQSVQTTNHFHLFIITLLHDGKNFLSSSASDVMYWWCKQQGTGLSMWNNQEKLNKGG